MRRVLALLLPPLVACASSPSPKPAPDLPSPKGAPSSSASATSGGAKNTPSLDAEVGALDAKQVKKNFEAILKKSEACQEDLRKKDPRLDFLAGDLRIELRIGEDGRVLSATLPSSSVGDLRLETCVLDAARALSWPRPEGGRTGLASNEMHFPMKGDREPIPWAADKAQPTLARAPLQPCAARGAVEVTVYIDTDGKVIAAGASAPDPERPETAACVVKAIQGLRFPSPGSWPAKVTVPLR